MKSALFRLIGRMAFNSLPENIKHDAEKLYQYINRHECMVNHESWKVGFNQAQQKWKNT